MSVSRTGPQVHTASLFPGNPALAAGGADKREAVRRALAGEVPSGMVQNAEWHVAADAFG